MTPSSLLSCRIAPLNYQNHRNRRTNSAIFNGVFGAAAAAPKNRKLILFSASCGQSCSRQAPLGSKGISAARPKPDPRPRLGR